MDKPLFKLRISSFDVDVNEWDNQGAQARMRYGEFSEVEKIIRIDTNQSPDQVLVTMMHEITHAIYRFYGLDDEDEEERLSTIFGVAWAQIFRDNPHLLQWISNQKKLIDGG